MVLALGVVVVMLGLQGGPELDAGLEEGAGFADRLKRAVELGWSGAIAIAEEAVVVAADAGHFGPSASAGSARGLSVAGFDLIGVRRYRGGSAKPRNRYSAVRLIPEDGANRPRPSSRTRSTPTQARKSVQISTVAGCVQFQPSSTPVHLASREGIR